MSSENVTNVTTFFTESPGLLEVDENDKITRAIIKYVAPVEIIVGVIGNSLNLAVLQRKELDYKLSSLYLSALAIADIAVLCTGLLDLWLHWGVGVELRSRDVAAKLFMFASYLSFHASSWLVVTVTLQRCFSVCFPFTVSKITQKHRIAIISVVVVTCASLDTHILLFYRVKPENAYKAYNYFLNHTWAIIDFLIACAIPSAVVTICNIAIIVANNRSNRRRRAVAATGHDSTRLTRLLMTLNIFFVVTTCPARIYYIYHGYVLDTQVHDASQFFRHKLTALPLILIMYLNNTLNFALYCVTGRRFRIALRAVVTSWYQCGQDILHSKNKH